MMPSPLPPSLTPNSISACVPTSRPTSDSSSIPSNPYLSSHSHHTLASFTPPPTHVCTTASTTLPTVPPPPSLPMYNTVAVLYSTADVFLANQKIFPATSANLKPHLINIIEIFTNSLLHSLKHYYPITNNSGE